MEKFTHDGITYEIDLPTDRSFWADVRTTLWTWLAGFLLQLGFLAFRRGFRARLPESEVRMVVDARSDFYVGGVLHDLGWQRVGTLTRAGLDLSKEAANAP